MADATTPPANGPSGAAAEEAAARGADEIGRNVAFYRRVRGLKAKELATRIGVSPSLISQIERGQSNPSVGTLVALAGVLGVPLDAFIGTPELPLAGGPAQPALPEAGARAAAGASPVDVGTRPRYVVRRAERASLEVAEGLRWERLTPETLNDVYFLEFVFAPGASSSPMVYSHPGFEMSVVVSGQLDVQIGFEQSSLGPGDTVTFPSTLPHRYVNASTEETHTICVVFGSGSLPMAPAQGQ